eukprot:13969718-Alexandrium_andersonii.AAC.1
MVRRRPSQLPGHGRRRRVPPGPAVPERVHVHSGGHRRRLLLLPGPGLRRGVRACGLGTFAARHGRSTA